MIIFLMENKYATGPTLLTDPTSWDALQMSNRVGDHRVSPSATHIFFVRNRRAACRHSRSDSALLPVDRSHVALRRGGTKENVAAAVHFFQRPACRKLRRIRHCVTRGRSAASIGSPSATSTRKSFIRFSSPV